MVYFLQWSPTYAKSPWRRPELSRSSPFPRAICSQPSLSACTFVDISFLNYTIVCTFLFFFPWEDRRGWSSSYEKFQKVSPYLPNMQFQSIVKVELHPRKWKHTLSKSLVRIFGIVGKTDHAPCKVGAKTDHWLLFNPGREPRLWDCNGQGWGICFMFSLCCDSWKDRRFRFWGKADSLYEEKAMLCKVFEDGNDTWVPCSRCLELARMSTLHCS